MTLQNIKISLRSDSLENWISSDPVLKNGELVMVNDISAGLVRFKVGNGVSAFVQLPYINEKKVITDFAKAKRAESQYFSQGVNNSASPLGFAAGSYLTADSSFSQVLGINAYALEGHDYSFVWNGDGSGAIGAQSYRSHGEGTFNVNPADGAAGVYIGEESLASMLSGVRPIEWADLVGLAQTSALNPGVKYRITDYVTTVDQEDCRSAGHPFDLIVTAIDNHTLDEHAVATLPSNGDDYFAARPFHYEPYQQYLEYRRVPLESWDIKYCLDNDSRRFAWADAENGKGVIYYMKDEFGNEAPYDFKNVQFKRYRITSSPGATYLEGMYGLPVAGIEVDEEDIMWCYTFNGTDYQDLALEEPYDFSGWHPTLTDTTIQQLEQQTGQTLMGIDRLNGCSKNTVLEWCESLGDYLWTSYALPNNVFQCQLDQTPLGDSVPFLKIGICTSNKLGLNCQSNTFGSGCNYNTFGSYCNGNIFGNDSRSNTFGNGYYNNIFGYNCYYNTFGSSCNGNIFGNDCYSNTFSNNCQSNTFGSGCNDNTFGNDCYYNTFSNSCQSNVFGNNCNHNTFGSHCDFNTFGNDCDSNTFDYNCDSNTFGNYCNSNTFGNSCNSNTFGNSCNSNTFGSNCYYNTFGSNCCSNTFGSDCGSNTFGDDCHIIKFASTATSDPDQAKSYYKYITVDSGNQNIILNCTQSTYSGHEYKNVRILPGVNNTTDYKRITDSNVNQNFCTTYQPENSQLITV